MKRCLSLGLFLVLASGCSSSDSLDVDGGTADGGASSGEGGAIGDGGSVGDGGSDEGSALCPEATGVYPLAPAPSNLLFLLDRSGSMHLRVGQTDTRWTLTTAGLGNILSSVSSDTVAGLAMFPSGDQPISCCAVTAGNFIDCTCAEGELPEPADRCDAATYETLAVSMDALSASHVDQMIDAVAVSDDEFYWGTPLAPALGGTLDAAVSMSLPGVTSVVLLTDGLPTSCDVTGDPGANDIVRALEAASAGASSGVRTYVVGIDAEAASSDPATDLAINLSQLAAAGGTASFAGCDATNDCAYLVNVDNFEQALAGALESIALEASSCTFELPTPDGGLPDYDAVNINVTSEGTTQAIPRDPSHASGWDYSPNQTQVILYGDACELMKNDAGAEIEVVVGCKTLEN
jgi:hypothetical protein